MKSRKYESEAAAFEHLRSIGKLIFFGRAGSDYEYCVCKIEVNGKTYRIDVYNDGNVILKE